MLRIALFAAALLPLACGRVLPSAEPLGVGPMAEVETTAAPTPERSAPPKVAPAPSAARLAEPSGPDGGTDSRTADAAPPSVVQPEAGATADAAPDEPLELAGEYFGEDVSIYRLPGVPEQTERDPKARTRVEQPQKDRLVIVIVDSSNGTPLCSVTAELAGRTATIAPGQPCFDDGEQGGRVESGKASFTGSRLVLDLDVELLDGDEVAGSLDYHFDGTRR